ncbi:MAG TPA: sugar phosphate isomerase/epimerase family protein [Planctomycetota bacterium]|nr:sugar phosphate isomerase/epimerase family protein [Planctomycetota bacterium]
MRFGICCGVGSFAPQCKDTPLSALPELLKKLKEAGADYVEFPVGAVAPDADEAEFEKLVRALEGSPLRVEVFNSFIPPKYRLTGPAIEYTAALKYCATALRRCKALGGEIIVFGSGAARRAPDGFGVLNAEAQFIDFCKLLGPLAEEAGIDIALEPLNSKEDNLLTTVAHGIKIVDAVNHPRIQLLADLFHMSQEREPLTHVAEAGKRLKHTHVADIGRVAPGFAKEGEEDFAGFFRNLRKASYFKRRCSFEGTFDDIKAQSGPLLQLLRKRWSESASPV